MKVLTKSGDWEKDRAMDIDHPLYRALSSGRKRVNGESLAVFLIHRSQFDPILGPTDICRRHR